MHTASTTDAPLYLGQHLYIKPSYIVSIPEYEKRSKPKTQSQLSNQKNLDDNTNGGILSKKSMTKLKNAINWLLISAEAKKVYDKNSGKHWYFKVNFITLTIPSQAGSMISNKEFKEVLHNWLMYMRKFHNLRNYIWKLESHKDGRLHIHLTTDTFLHHRKIRNVWNSQLKRKGWLDAYFSTKGHYDANSTDVHSVRKIRSLAAYLVKYMAKDSHLPQGFQGRIWSSNYELSNANKCSMYVDPSELSEVLADLYSKNIEYKPINGKPDIFGHCRQLGDLFLLKASDWRDHIKGRIREVFDQHRRMICENSFHPPNTIFSIN